jgi:hypothetical protein
VLPAAASPPGYCDTPAQASEPVVNLRGVNVTWKAGPGPAGPKVRIIRSYMDVLVGRVGSVVRTGRLTQGTGTDASVYLLELESTSRGRKVHVITLEKNTSELHETQLSQPSLASPAAGSAVPVIPTPTKPTKRAKAMPQASAAALDESGNAVALLQSGARCGHICHIPSRNRN